MIVNITDSVKVLSKKSEKNFFFFYICFLGVLCENSPGCYYWTWSNSRPEQYEDMTSKDIEYWATVKFAFIIALQLKCV